MAVTIRDVAKRCGMSISTVSKVFNGYVDISAQTRDEVMRVAREIGYQPNAIARALKTHRTYNVGVLFVGDSLSGITHPFFASVLNAFKAEAEHQGYDITFINHHLGERPMTYLEHCRYRNVDGVCLACVDFYSMEVAELVNSDIPCVTVDYVREGSAAVCSDNEGGAKLLVEYAASLGHRRVAFIHGQRNSEVTEARIHSYLSAMEDRGLPVPEGYLTEGRYDDVPVVRRAVRAMLARDDAPTCVLLPDDASYLGALEAAQAAGLRVPEDLSLAGYDGIRLTQTLRPRLTTVRQHSEAMGREAALRLIDAIAHPHAAPEVVRIPVELVEGQTVAALKN